LTEYLLVHGGCHGAWCWEALLPHLPAKAIDLPGHGRNVPLAGLEDGIAAICDTLVRIGKPVTLVGHSLGGMAISGAAEWMPDAVARLVYLSALLPGDGESAATIPMPELGANTATLVSADGQWTSLDPEKTPTIFYQDCTPQAVTAALARIGATALDYVTAPLTLTAENFGRVPKTYIHCLADRAIQIEAQRAMTARYPGIHTVTLDSGHSPFLSMPEALTEALHTLPR
jgi:pimeloyl-ACP methyl ester carboxylesterase